MARQVRVALGGLSVGERSLAGEPAHYLANVQRIRAGDRFLAFDTEACVEGEALVLEVTKKHVRVRVELVRDARRASLGVHLLQCLGKGDKVDEVVRAATALGVSSITVCDSERAVQKLGERAGARLDRWQSISLSAAQQCGRGDLPQLVGPVGLEAALESVAPSVLRVCLHPRAALRYGALLETLGDRELALLVGPEGGFSDDELALAERAGFVLASFGAFELRTELAGVAALGAVLARR